MFELNIPDYFVKCSPAPTPQVLLYLMQSFTFQKLELFCSCVCFLIYYLSLHIRM